MRRADRLFQIVQLIRGRRLTTAAFLAERLEVSERTVYRDIADLQHQGVPIEGEAGVGYRLGAGFELPPLMFTQDEASALVAAARLAQSWVDPAMARDIETGLGKILSVLPPSARVSAEALALYAPALGLSDLLRERLQTLREAVQSRHKLHLVYRDVAGEPSERTVRPLGCFYWGRSGRCRPGASCARTSAVFASTASTRSRCWPSAFATNPARRWPTCCAR